mgnify:CR=1 FL=1
MSPEIIGTRVGTAPVPVSILDFAMAGQGLSGLLGEAGRRIMSRHLKDSNMPDILHRETALRPYWLARPGRGRGALTTGLVRDGAPRTGSH